MIFKRSTIQNNLGTVKTTSGSSIIIELCPIAVKNCEVCKMKFYSRWLSLLLRNIGPLNRIVSKLAFLANVTPIVKTEVSGDASSKALNYDFHRRIVEISKILRVERVIDPIVEFSRFGNRFDGGYVMVHDFNGNDALVSLGVGNDVTLEAELSKVIAKVHLYDHTVSSLPQSVRNAVFHKEEIGYVKERAVTLEETILRLKPAGDLLLKMDIEGSEWEVLEGTISLGTFKQIVIEFHGLHRLINVDYFVKTVSALRKIHSTHAPVHLHANNYSSLAIIGNVAVPDIIEVTYVSRSRYKTTLFEPLPGAEFDSPNSSLTPEIALLFPLPTRFDRI